MKNLIYKELKLAWHPIIYVFIIVFPLMALIPSYPTWIGYIYVCSCYPILFLGANKGQQSNDIYYTALLPVRKKDIVLARIFSLVIMIGITMLLMGALTPLAISLRDTAIEEVYKDLLVNNPNMSTEVARATATEQFIYGLLPHEAFFTTSGFALLAFSFFNYFFLTWFYRNGRSILLPSILGILGFMIILGILTMLLPLTISGFTEFFTNIVVQIVTFVVCLIIYVVVLFIAYKVSCKNLEKVNL